MVSDFSVTRYTRDADTGVLTRFLSMGIIKLFLSTRDNAPFRLRRLGVPPGGRYIYLSGGDMGLAVIEVPPLPVRDQSLVTPVRDPPGGLPPGFANHSIKTDGMQGTSHIRCIAFSPDGRDVYLTSAALNSVTVLRMNDDVPTGIADRIAPAAATRGTPSLASAAPNPFNAQTTLTYTLPEAGRVTIVIADILGRTVRWLVQGPVPGGTHTIGWDGRNDQGIQVSSGIYIVRLRTGGASLTRKMLLLR